MIFEIGPGAGALTALMAEKASAVVAVEIDEAMAELTAEAVAGRANVRVLHARRTASKHEIDPQVLDNVRAGLAVAPNRRFKLVANLPYNVATPVISNLLVHPELCPALLVVTIQLELAERMRAAPATGSYGALSAMVQALADVEVVRILSPKVFWPRPKVASAIVKITPSAEKRGPWATCRGITPSCVASSSIAARTSAAYCSASGATAGPSPKSMPSSKHWD